MTTARPPWVSVPMGALAGRPFEPAKRSAIHGRQREQGATVKWAGDWRRAYDYGDPEAEALAVHESAGVIDVSTLGKLLVRGPGAGELLDRLYPNRFSNLKPGRIRYGVMTSDAGRIIDDGTICRLDDDSFYVTTTSSGAGAIEEWFGWWLADLGPRRARHRRHPGARRGQPRRARSAREILAGLTDARHLAPRASPTSTRKQAQVAGVDALLLRIGFVGEVGYEIHFPAAYGEHVWDALVAAGARPFGLEPQRDPAAAEAARDRRPGHRLRVDALRRGDAVDRQARQGAGLHRPLGARARRRASRRVRAGRLHDGRRPRPDRGRGGARRGGQVGRSRVARARRQLGQAIGMAWVPPGAGRGRRARSRSPTRARPTRRP